MDIKLLIKLSSVFLNYNDCINLLLLNKHFREYEKNGWLKPSN